MFIQGAMVIKYIILLTFILFLLPALVFSTPFVDIKKSYTKDQVEKILGKLHHSKATDNVDIWYYCFGNDKRLFVYFMDGKVVEVNDKEDVEI